MPAHDDICTSQNERINRVEVAMHEVNTALELRFDRMDEKFAALAEQMKTLTEKVDKLNERQAHLEARLERQKSFFAGIAAAVSAFGALIGFLISHAITYIKQ